MAVFSRKPGLSRSYHESAVRHRRVVTLHLFLCDKVNRRVIVRKIVGHGLNLFFDLFFVRPVFCDNEAFARVLFARRKRRVLAASHFLKRLGNGNGVLARVGNAVDAAYRVRMALAHASAPEGVVVALGKD